MMIIILSYDDHHIIIQHKRPNMCYILEKLVAPVALVTPVAMVASVVRCALD